MFKTICIALLSACLWATDARAQKTCANTDTVHFERIFGEDRLLSTGKDTIWLANGNRLIYSCWTCDICCINTSDHVIWRRDLSPYGCRLLAFMKIEAHPKGSDPKQNVMIQAEDKRIFVLKVRNGKLRQVKW